MRKIIFFTTFGCSLCEKVEQMFSQFFLANPDEKNINLEVFDIIDDEQILNKYRTKIPVLKNENNDTELCWPFSYQELENFLTV